MEKIPADEIPPTQMRKKKTMTPEMLEQLALARKKALEIKKALKNDEQAQIEHEKEKLKKGRKLTKKEMIKMEAEKQLAKEEEDAETHQTHDKTAASKDPEKEVLKEPEIHPDDIEKEVEEKVEDKLTEDAIKESKEDEATHTESPKLKPKKSHKSKKQVFLFSSDSESDSSDDEVVYVKRRTKKKSSKKPVEAPAPSRPVNLYQRGIPPSLIDARNGMGVFGQSFRFGGRR